jgi:hypothetical protein
MARTKRYWHIVGYDSTTKIYEDKVLHGCYTEQQMANLLRALVSRARLEYQEIVDSYARSNTSRYKSLLRVRPGSGPKKFSLECGSNPYFIASVVEE